MIRNLKQYIGNRNPLRLGWHFAKAFTAALCFGFPARKLTVIGITGTDGKTTTVAMTAHILNEVGIPSGALSTAFFQIRKDITWNETQKTSPSPFVVQRFLRKLVSVGCTHAVLEYSSHGLVQGRTHYTWPSIATITNISMEHLDYHGSMDQYIKDKGKLFLMLRSTGTKVLNADDASYEKLKTISTGHTIEYSDNLDTTSLHLKNIKTESSSSSAEVCIGDDQVHLNLNIPGSFNVNNALCSIACAQAAGVSAMKAIKALETFTCVPGRMELIDEGQSFSVYVDFTVTPAAYEKTLKTLREMIGPDKRILVLTGSCGDRMKEKRPIVGALCSELADVVVVSNEDPYTEDPQTIIDEVWAGVDQSQCEAKQIFDRKEAIEYLCKNAQPGDAVILCAKGSDTTMWVKNGQIPWNEREIVRGILKSQK